MSGVSLSDLRVSVQIPQSAIEADPRIAERPTSCSTATAVAAVAASKVTVFPYADPATHTFTVRLDLPGEDTGLYPGMTVKVAFATGEAERLLVPATRTGPARRTAVGLYVVDEHGVSLRQVRTGHASWRSRRDTRRPRRGRTIRRRSRSRGAMARRRQRARSSAVSEPRLGFSGRIARAFQSSPLTPVLALAAILLGIAATADHAARGRAADRRDHGQRDRAVSPAPMCATSRIWSPFRSSRSSPRSKASSTSIRSSRPGVAVAHRRIRGRRAATDRDRAPLQPGLPEPGFRAAGTRRRPAADPADGHRRRAGHGADPVERRRGPGAGPAGRSRAHAGNRTQAHSRHARRLHDRRARTRGRRSNSMRPGWPPTACRSPTCPPRCSAANAVTQAGDRIDADRDIPVTAGTFLANAADVAALVIGLKNGQPVFLSDVADIQPGADLPDDAMSGSARRPARPGPASRQRAGGDPRHRQEARQQRGRHHAAR